ncbi:P-loop containing nucleoside triphosphate hydrolase protein [Pavlovales sp. CCMP2436]|nr:P-loop containing nucleoside triphosphate hydrolase protein [Pavlovales sp. CCMP2436]
MADSVPDADTDGPAPTSMYKGEEQLFEKKLSKEEKKLLMAEKKAARDAKKGDGKGDGKKEAKKGETKPDDLVDDLVGLTAGQARVASARNATAVLSSMKGARDIKFEAFSVQIGGINFVNDCKLELSQGCRYGLIGENGSGKSNVLAAIAQRDVPLPLEVDVFHLHQEAEPTEQTAVEAVVGHVIAETARIEAISMEILEESGPDDVRLAPLYERLDELDPTGAEPRARKILSGLGFDNKLIPMDRKTKDMSGGWRMRVSLAQALFAAPSVLLLDEPTNHLDLEACVWLEQHLATYPKCLLVVSHSQDFLNAVCTHTVRLHAQTLTYYGGNYNMFCTVLADEERVLCKAYEKQQKLETFVRVNKANGVASSAKSKQKPASER